MKHTGNTSIDIVSFAITIGARYAVEVQPQQFEFPGSPDFTLAG